MDVRDFKKLLRTKTNVLVCFTSSLKQSASALKAFKEAAQIVRGQGTMVLVDCSAGFVFCFVLRLRLCAVVWFL